MYPIWLYVLVVSTSLYLISTLFTLRPAVLELQAQGLQAISRKVHQITPNWLWSLQGQMYPIYLLLLSTSLQFQSVSLYEHRFRDTGHFKTSAPKTPEMTLTLQGQF